MVVDDTSQPDRCIRMKTLIAFLHVDFLKWGVSYELHHSRTTFLEHPFFTVVLVPQPVTLILKFDLFKIYMIVKIRICFQNQVACFLFSLLWAVLQEVNPL